MALRDCLWLQAAPGGGPAELRERGGRVPAVGGCDPVRGAGAGRAE